MKKFISLEDNVRLERFLGRVCNAPSVLFIKLIRQNKVFINGKLARQGQRVNLHDVVILEESVNIKDKKEVDSPKSLIFNNMIFESDRFIYMNKPYGTASQSGTKVFQNVADACEKASCLMVHRLDKETSGVMALAKNRDSATFFMKRSSFSFEEKKRIAKVYLAILDGTLKENILVDRPLEKFFTHVAPSDNGKDAKTLFFPISNKNGLTLALVSPLTGRTHQIRVHSEYINMPILGDNKYNRTIDTKDIKSNRKERMFLHALSLFVEDEPIIFAQPDNMFLEKISMFNKNFETLIKITKKITLDLV